MERERLVRRWGSGREAEVGEVSLGVGLRVYHFDHLLQTLRVLIRLHLATTKLSSGAGLPLFVVLSPAQSLRCLSVTSIELVYIYLCVGCGGNLCVCSEA